MVELIFDIIRVPICFAIEIFLGEKLREMMNDGQRDL